MSTNTKEYFLQYRTKNAEKIREIEKRSLLKRRADPIWREKTRVKKRIYIEMYRRRLGMPKRNFTGVGKEKLGVWLPILAEKYGMKCARCGTEERLTINHKIPRCIGGKTEEINLEIMCLSCNIKEFHNLTKKALRFYFQSG